MLQKEELQGLLEHLPGWVYRDHALEKSWQFFVFGELILFLKKCIKTMGEQNHHADLLLDTKNKILTLKVTTHSVGAVTRADVDFAQAVERLL